MFPKELSRVTKHKKPQHQLYQPGFNDSNGCWLPGSWVTVPAEEFSSRKKAHEKLYKNVFKEATKQSHHGKKVALKNMTEAQRQAYEHFSGEATLDVRFPNGSIGKVKAQLAGQRVSEATIRWIREKGWKVIPKVLQPNKKVDDQAKLVPADVLSDDTEPVNVWKHIVAENKAWAREFAKATAEMSRGGSIPGLPEGAPMPDPSFMGGVAIQTLFQIEEQIIRHETSKRPDPYETPEETKAEYVEHRAEMKKALGDKFEEVYNAAKVTHNECARVNLDNSKGFLACYVLPVFRDDGSHDPIGPKDFPWDRRD